MIAIHTLNPSPTSAIPNMTPYQAYLGTKPDILHFFVSSAVMPMSVSKKD